MDAPAAIEQFRIRTAPNYIPQGDEEAVFRAAAAARLPVLLKGPTGCGKTRFVEHMAFQLGLPLVTVSCHEDLTAADLVGRFLFRDEQTVWQDGPLTLAVRHGGLCYLDEIVEARKDTTVVIHSLTDDRRMLFLDRTGEVVRAHPDFLVVLSYNPGYQSLVKELKPSTRQRFVSIEFTHPVAAVETRIIASETGLPEADSRRLADLGARIRALPGPGLDAGVGTRLLVHAGRLMRCGLPPLAACRAALGHVLSDDPELTDAIEQLAGLHFGAPDAESGHAPCRDNPGQ